MRKILIVDDSRLNRMVLRELLREYERKNGKTEFGLTEAENGVEAVELARTLQPDIIFMDIMMPMMDGIEATAAIKKEQKTMIIAVSAIDDDDSKRDILAMGAEDYIAKPVNADIFAKRIENYLTILNARTVEHMSIEAINLFDNRIYSRKLTFVVLDERTLGEFWDYYLAGDTKIADQAPDLVRLLWGLGMWQIKLGYKFYITVEEGCENFYFTMNNMKLLKSEIVEGIIFKNFPQAIYALDGDRLSFMLAKSHVQPNASLSQLKKEESEQESSVAKEATVQEQPQKPLQKPIAEKEQLHVFDFLEREDLAELEEIASELNTTMLLVGSSTLDDAEVEAIASHINGFGKILSAYSETYAVAQAFKELSGDILGNIRSFQEKSQDIAMLCRAFNEDLKLWITKLFYEGAPSVDFLDKSMISNANMISAFIKPQEAAADSLDDIFDF